MQYNDIWNVKVVPNTYCIALSTTIFHASLYRVTFPVLYIHIMWFVFVSFAVEHGLWTIERSFLYLLLHIVIRNLRQWEKGCNASWNCNFKRQDFLHLHIVSTWLKKFRYVQKTLILRPPLGLAKKKKLVSTTWLFHYGVKIHVHTETRKLVYFFVFFMRWS